MREKATYKDAAHLKLILEVAISMDEIPGSSDHSIHRIPPQKFCSLSLPPPPTDPEVAEWVGYSLVCGFIISRL